MNKFVLPVLQDSYAWRVYFDALSKAMLSEVPGEGTFAQNFCQEPLIGKKISDFDHEELSETQYKVYIDTDQRLTFSGATVSQDNVLFEQSNSPLNGIIYIRTQNGLSTEIIDCQGTYIDLWKADACIRRLFYSPTTKYTTDVLKRKLDSFYLLKWVFQRQGFDYEVDMGNEMMIEYEVPEMLEVLTSGKQVLYKITKGDLRLTDTIKVGGREYPISALSDTELKSDLNLSKGLYTIVRKQQYAPLSNTPPLSLMLIYMLDRADKSRIRALLDREAPMRIGTSVLYFDIVLLANLKYRGWYEIPSLDGQLFVVDGPQGYHVLDSIKLDWKAGSSGDIYLCSNEVSWELVFHDDWFTATPKTYKIPQGTHWKCQKVTLTTLKYNRVFEEIPKTVKFVGIHRLTGEKIECEFTVIIKKWDPTVCLLNVGEDLFVKQSFHKAVTQQLPNFKDNFDVTENSTIEETLPKRLSVSEDMFVNTSTQKRLFARYELNIKEQFDIAQSSSVKDRTERTFEVSISEDMLVSQETEVQETLPYRIGNISEDLYLGTEVDIHKIQNIELDIKDNVDVSVAVEQRLD